MMGRIFHGQPLMKPSHLREGQQKCIDVGSDFLWCGHAKMQPMGATPCHHDLQKTIDCYEGCQELLLELAEHVLGSC